MASARPQGELPAQRLAYSVIHRYDGGTTLAPGVSDVTDWRVQYGEDNLIVPVSEAPAGQADLQLPDDYAFDAPTLAGEVGRRLMLQAPPNDAWR